jgi:hypothetical protein
MKFLLFLSLIVFSTTAFAKDDPLVLAPIEPATVQALKARRALLRTWAPKCSDGSLTMSDCPFWDAVEYMGMLCLSGEVEYCKQVKDAQDPVSGRWWRSAGFRLNPNPAVTGPTFSGDMDHGVWAYTIATEDREAILKYMSYVRENNYKLCPKSVEGWDACATRATYWTFAHQVYDWLGLPPDKKKMKGYKYLIDSLYSPLEALTEPKTFQMILTAEGIYMLQKIREKGGEIKNPKLLQKIANILHRRVPEVPFYEYLAYGPNESSAEKILKICPSIAPVVPIQDGHPVYSEPANGPWEQGSGHYCIFMINAILGSAN